MKVATLFSDNDCAEVNAISEYARKFWVFVETRKKYGGGVLVEPGLVITTYHFIKSLKDLRVDRLHAKLLFFDKKLDFAALYVPLKPVQKLRIVGLPKKGEPAVILVPVIGSERIHKRVVCAVCTGKIAYSDPQIVVGDMLTSAGSCGSGLFVQEGLAGMVDSDKNISFVQSPSGEILKEFIRVVHKVIRQRRNQIRRRISGPVYRQARLAFPPARPFVFNNW